MVASVLPATILWACSGQWVADRAANDERHLLVQGPARLLSALSALIDERQKLGINFPSFTHFVH